jgi:peptidoglycan/xylan/chitin deacetylase (PgdA/CDA1 family)
MRGHLFCSTRCARDSDRLVVWHRVRSQLFRPVPARVAVAAVALAASAPMILALRTVRDLDRLNEPAPLARSNRGAGRATLESVVETPKGARLEGTAPEGTAVFLFAGGRFVATAPSEAGRFRFEGVSLPGPYRVGALPLSEERPLEAGSAPAATPPAESTPTRFLPARPSPAPRRIASAPEAPPAPRRGIGAPDITRGPSDRPEILVSFDAGSSDRGAAVILDALSRRGIHTTIFLTGEFIRRYSETVRRIAEDGHEVGNHTDTHPHLTTYAADGRQITRLGVDRAFVTGELARTARLYRDATGRSMAPLWRAPFGEHNAEIRRWAAELGYWHVGWTGGRSGLDGMDWVTDPRSRSYRSAERLIARLVQRAENGGIVLLHLGSDRDEPVASRIGALLDGLRGRGFRFARASEFLEREGFDAARLAAFRSPSVPGSAR